MQLRRKPHSPKCKRPRKQAFVSEISTRAQCFNKHTPNAISCTTVTLHVYVRATNDNSAWRLTPNVQIGTSFDNPHMQEISEFVLP